MQWPTAIPDVPVSELSIYPNPFTDFFTIKTPNFSEVNSVAVYNLLGAQVTSITHPQSSDIRIDMSQHAAGIYVYKLTYNNGNISSGKLYKQ